MGSSQVRRTHLEAGNVKTTPLFLPPSSERERWPDARAHNDRPLPMGWRRNQTDEGAKAVSLFVWANRLLVEICTPGPQAACVGRKGGRGGAGGISQEDYFLL